jgi:hypothetical protein
MSKKESVKQPLTKVHAQQVVTWSNGDQEEILLVAAGLQLQREAYIQRSTHAVHIYAKAAAQQGR